MQTSTELQGFHLSDPKPSRYVPSPKNSRLPWDNPNSFGVGDISPELKIVTKSCGYQIAILKWNHLMRIHWRSSLVPAALVTQQYCAKPKLGPWSKGTSGVICFVPHLLGRCKKDKSESIFTYNIFINH